MKNLIITLFLFICTGTAAFAQRDIEEFDEPTIWDRMYFGGGGTLQFGDITIIGASPIVGYMITNRLSAGVGVTYQYINYRFIDWSTNTYGGRVFTRYNITPAIFAMGEYESLNMELHGRNTDLPRVWVDRLLLGGGYFQPFGRRGGVNIGLMYDFLYMQGSSPYRSPWVYRFGFTF